LSTLLLENGYLVHGHLRKLSLGVLVRLELYPDKDGPDFHFLGHELCLRSPRPKPITA